MPAMLVLSAVLFVQGELSAPASGLSGALFGAIWIATIYLILMASARITLTDEELIWERWGKRRAVRLASITRLEHRVTGNALIVHGIEGSIRVEEQLEGYPQFFRALLDRV